LPFEKLGRDVILAFSAFARFSEPARFSESNANGRFLVSARFCDAEEDADGRVLASARFCDAYANGRIAFFRIDFCNSYANGRISFFAIDVCNLSAKGRIDFFGIEYACVPKIRDNMAQYGTYKIKSGEKSALKKKRCHFFPDDTRDA